MAGCYNGSRLTVQKRLKTTALNVQQSEGIHNCKKWDI